MLQVTSLLVLYNLMCSREEHIDDVRRFNAFELIFLSDCRTSIRLHHTDQKHFTLPKLQRSSFDLVARAPFGPRLLGLDTFCKSPSLRRLLRPPALPVLTPLSLCGAAVAVAPLKLSLSIPFSFYCSLLTSNWSSLQKVKQTDRKREEKKSKKIEDQLQSTASAQWSRVLSRWCAYFQQ